MSAPAATTAGLIYFSGIGVLVRLSNMARSMRLQHQGPVK
jgi:hypothetical protein